MKIYAPDSIAELPWPGTAFGRLARDYLAPLVARGSGAYFSDRVRMRVALLGDQVFPLAIAEGQPGNSSNCSVSARYIDIPALALRQMPWHPLKVRAARGALAALGAMLRAGAIERCVYIGNGLVFRGMEPHLERAQVEQLRDALSAAYPDHALVFSALNPVTHPALLNHLAACGYSFLFSGHSRVWMPHWDTGRRRAYKRRHEARLLAESGYSLVDGTGRVACAPRLAALYKALNRDKYVTNTMAKEELFERILRGSSIQVRLLEQDGRVDGFFAYAVTNGLMCAPLFGYDTALPQSLGLYRMLSAAMFDEAESRGLGIETGAGADAFKRHRGDRPVPRYGAYYVGHLGPHRRAAWSVLARYANAVYAPATRQFLQPIDGADADGIERIPEVFRQPFETPAQVAEGLVREAAELGQALHSAAAGADAAADADVDAAAYASAIDARLTALAEALDRWPYAEELVAPARAQVAAAQQRSAEQARAQAQAARDASADSGRRLCERAQLAGGVPVVIGALEDAPADALDEIAAAVQAQLEGGRGAVLLGSVHQGRALLVCALSPELVGPELSAGALLAQILPLVAGKGGGRPNYARGGGSQPEALEQALAAGRERLTRLLEQRASAAE
ncbi:GNAT family N-acetyltransferase [Haliangium ochraceum]|uniref:Alanine--tRNA ligase n=1 Tax=Haliangium ochraceum (strain DSM 14365 / JCM 11303 / SMP-2) TaxID=502025 RepID=D0LXW2_HALO1|nr:GNAT family N-acetyltransferase [Haliangium ochraceum]ACY14317.1 phosphoesterase DHHA1 [Haliangium ochraceum DSM 14365]